MVTYLTIYCQGGLQALFNQNIHGSLLAFADEPREPDASGGCAGVIYASILTIRVEDIQTVRETFFCLYK